MEQTKVSRTRLPFAKISVLIFHPHNEILEQMQCRKDYFDHKVVEITFSILIN